jgi:hypothetical protein
MACFHAGLPLMHERTDYSGGFHFALPRLFLSLLGERPIRSENNFAEALWAGAIAILLPWLALLDMTGAFHCSLGWLSAIALFAAIIPLWLILFYLNSLLIALCRRTRLLTNYPNRTMQHALALIMIALSSARLAFSESLVHWIGIAVLTLIAVDLFAAVALPLAHDPPSATVRE